MRCVRASAAYLHGHGRGGKVKRVLANRQSAQRSRIRKLQHISELEVTLEALQHDLFKLNPQLTKLEAKQAGKQVQIGSVALAARSGVPFHCTSSSGKSQHDYLSVLLGKQLLSAHLLRAANGPYYHERFSVLFWQPVLSSQKGDSHYVQLPALSSMLADSHALVRCCAGVIAVKVIPDWGPLLLSTNVYCL